MLAGRSRPSLVYLDYGVTIGATHPSRAGAANRMSCAAFEFCCSQRLCNTTVVVRSLSSRCVQVVDIVLLLVEHVKTSKLIFHRIKGSARVNVERGPIDWKAQEGHPCTLRELPQIAAVRLLLQQKRATNAEPTPLLNSSTTNVFNAEQ